VKDWFTYLAVHGGDWRSVTLEDVAGFVAWLRLPPQARDGTVAVLSTGRAFGRQREPQARGVGVVLRGSRPPRHRVDGAAGHLALMSLPTLRLSRKRLRHYIDDAERGGDQQLIELFRRAQAASRKGAEEGKKLLAERLNHCG
jgi:hypothetical protein